MFSAWYINLERPCSRLTRCCYNLEAGSKRGYPTFQQCKHVTLYPYFKKPLLRRIRRGHTPSLRVAGLHPHSLGNLRYNNVDIVDVEALNRNRLFLLCFSFLLVYFRFVFRIPSFHTFSFR